MLCPSIELLLGTHCQYNWLNITFLVAKTQDSERAKLSFLIDVKLIGANIQARVQAVSFNSHIRRRHQKTWHLKRGIETISLQKFGLHQRNPKALRLKDVISEDKN